MIVLCGPTAVGKTKTAIQLARHFNTDIISADSRQIYKELNIGTAKPNKQELALINHHFINHISIHDDYSAGNYEGEVIDRLQKLFTEKSIVICAGGTGLYLKAVTEGFDDIPKVDPSIRNQLIEVFNEQGLEQLQLELKEVDMASYNAIDIQNPQRVIRALEIFRGTGKPLSSYHKRDKKHREFNTIKIGLKMDRSALYDRINKRVDQMIKDGLLEEVISLKASEHLNALQTVGYSELFDYINGETSLERAIELIKRNSRRYAKRQMTWFRKDKDIRWFEADEFEEITEFIKSSVLG